MLELFWQLLISGGLCKVVELAGEGCVIKRAKLSSFFHMKPSCATRAVGLTTRECWAGQ